jgi:hypothetical protein
MPAGHYRHPLTRRTVYLLAALFLIGTVYARAQQSTLDVKEIVRRGVEADEQNATLARNYTYQQRVVQKELDKNGGVKKQEIKTYDLTILYGQLYSRLIQMDDKPLSDKEQRKQEEKLDKFIAKHKNEGEDDRRKRDEKEEKQRKEDRAFFQDLVKAFDFKMLPEEQVDGRNVYVIEATPRPDFHPTQPHADILQKIKGKLWIDKETFEWVRAECEAIDTISFGVFILRLHKGSRLTFEQTRINNEVWLPKRVSVDANARVMVFKNSGFQSETLYSNYKKFAASTKVLPGVREVTPAQQPEK